LAEKEEISKLISLTDKLEMDWLYQYPTKGGFAD